MAFNTDVHSTKKFRLGTTKDGVDGNRYVYLKGATSVAAGDAVVFVGSAYTAIRATTTGPTRGQIAIAQAAVDTSSKYGWFMIRGYYATANVATHSGGSGVALALSSSSGRLTVTPATELMTTGAFSAGDSASNAGPVFLSGAAVAVGDIST